MSINMKLDSKKKKVLFSCSIIILAICAILIGKNYKNNKVNISLRIPPEIFTLLFL